MEHNLINPIVVPISNPTPIGSLSAESLAAAAEEKASLKRKRQPWDECKLCGKKHHPTEGKKAAECIAKQSGDKQTAELIVRKPWDVCALCGKKHHPTEGKKAAECIARQSGDKQTVDLVVRKPWETCALCGKKHHPTEGKKAGECISRQTGERPPVAEAVARKPWEECAICGKRHHPTEGKKATECIARQAGEHKPSSNDDTLDAKETGDDSNSDQSQRNALLVGSWNLLADKKKIGNLKVNPDLLQAEVTMIKKGPDAIELELKSKKLLKAPSLVYSGISQSWGGIETAYKVNVEIHINGDGGMEGTFTISSEGDQAPADALGDVYEFVGLRATGK